MLSYAGRLIEARDQAKDCGEKGEGRALSVVESVGELSPFAVSVLGGRVEASSAVRDMRKRLIRFKTAMGGYCKKLAWIWDGDHFGLGSATLLLGVGAMP